MQVEELLLEGNKVLHKDQVRLILGEILNLNSLELTFHLKDYVEEDKTQKFLEVIKNIKQGLPIQYALKSVNFYGLNFYVDERVLIPRFETEELVYYTDHYLKKYFKNKELEILDLGTGSGCIGLTLKYLDQKRKLTLSDLSPYALEVAYINQQNLNLDVELKESDLFCNINKKYDVIISNPPYIAKEDEVEDIVSLNEPSMALYASSNGLYFYQRILENCQDYLKEEYCIAFEIGSNQKDQILKLIDKYLEGVSVITKQDMSLKDRMIFIFKNIEINE